MTNGLFRPTDGKTDGAILAMNGRKSKKLGGLLENEADVGTEVLIFADRTGHDETIVLSLTRHSDSAIAAI